MTALAFFAMFVAIKLIVVPPHLWTTGAWALLALVWRDALTASTIGLVDYVLVRRRLRTLRAATYVALVAVIAVNIPVQRALGTPLTGPMIRAAGGPLADSIALYVTWSNALLIAAISGMGYAAWRARVRGKGWTVCAAVVVALCIAVGPIASGRAYVSGLDRNLLAVLVTSGSPRLGATARPYEWRRSPVDGSARFDDLTSLVGLARDANIIVVSLESTAAQYLGVYGDAPDPMPRLTQLTANAVVFDAAYAVYPESIKGLYSILCSRFPALDSDVEVYAHGRCDSAAAVLSARGYRTGLFHSGRFDYLGMRGIVEHRGFNTLEDAGDIGGVRESSFGVDDESTVRRILAWIDGVPRGQRFAVTYLPVAGHHPYEAPRLGVFTGGRERDHYLNALQWGDAALGKLVDGVRARGLEQDTVWVILGDHGEAFGQHVANFAHTFFVYEENVHVPFIIAAPGRLHDTRHVSRVVSLVDTAPTILDLAALSAPASYEGRSMLQPEAAMALMFTDYSLKLAALRDGAWKYVYDLGQAHSELYDLAADPTERTNLADLHRDRTVAYQHHLEAWIAAELLRSRQSAAN